MCRQNNSCYCQAVLLALENFDAYCLAMLNFHGFPYFNFSLPFLTQVTTHMITSQNSQEP